MSWDGTSWGRMFPFFLTSLIGFQCFGRWVSWSPPAARPRHIITSFRVGKDTPWEPDYFLDVLIGVDDVAFLTSFLRVGSSLPVSCPTRLVLFSPGGRTSSTVSSTRDFSFVLRLSQTLLPLLLSVYPRLPCRTRFRPSISVLSRSMWTRHGES